VKREYRLGLVRRSPAFGLLFLAIAGSSFGTYVAAIVLTVDVYDGAESNRGLWIAALLIADFLPIVLIGLLLGPLVDRLSRRRLMVVSDIVRFGVFAALPFVDSPAAIVALAGVAGVATGFFRPASLAGLPNLVPDDELTNANSLIQVVETLAWMIGPVLGALMYATFGPSVPYAVNAVTFLVSAVLIAGISESKLRSEESLTRGHWRDVADGIRLVLTSAPLRTVLIVWNVVLLGSAAINVAEIFFARETLDAGTVGFGVLVAASGVGLALGAYLAAPALGKVGLRRHYAGSIGLMAVGWGGAAFSGSIWVAVPLVIGGAAGNGAAIICNQILVQRGAPDRYRGRALATIMSTNYAVLGLAMGATGVLTDVYGARAVWIAAGAIFLAGAVVSLLVTRWLPVSVTDGDDLLDRHGQAAAAALAGEVSPALAGEVVSEPVSALEPEPVVLLPPPVAEPTYVPEPEYAPEPEYVPEPEYAPEPVSALTDGSSRGSLERIAVLLEEIERRRELEARRSA
jgi:MFS transporter, DHA3 family, macrolide efflux protein